jgi:methionyl-tRNA formyltransferase
MISSNKVLFFGTPEISKIILEALKETNCEIVGIVTNPDKPSNRGKIINSPVKQFALDNNVKLFQPENLKGFDLTAKELNPDIIITCAYGKIIPESVLKLPKYKSVNIHTSLLPKYRGAAPIHYAILNGDKETGVTLMYMDKGMDTGNIIFQHSIYVASDETYTSLYYKLAELGASMIKEHLNELCSDSIKNTIQDETQATYTKKIEAKDEEID